MAEKSIAIVAITDPAEVTSKLDQLDNPYTPGCIFVTCPELGYEGKDIIFCRYALSIPYYQIKVGDRVWIEPTIGETERWVYTGFVDCGSEDVDPTIADTQGIVAFEDGILNLTIGTTMSVVFSTVDNTITIISGDDTYKVKMDADNSNIEVTAGSNVLKLDGSANKVTINGTNLEVLV